MTHEYTVKVYADAVEAQLRSIETVPAEYRKEVEAELWDRKRRKSP